MDRLQWLDQNGWHSRPVTGRPGEWITYMGDPMQFQGPLPPAPQMPHLLKGPESLTTEASNSFRRVVDDLLRCYDPGGYRLLCPVAGCRWQLDVPRMELDPEPLEQATGNYVVHAEGVPREDVERALAAHIDWHATLTETGAQDAPLPSPPEWTRWDLDLLHDGQDEARETGR
jgi:hypothetical protein